MDINQNPIFILASGLRCGSTLIQRLLNSNPDVLILGEQGGYLNGFYNSYLQLKRWCDDHQDQRELYLKQGYDNFIPNLSPTRDETHDAAKKYIEYLFAIPAIKMGKQIWGFKEVRYDVDVALFLQNIFPHSRFIYLTRNVVDCYLSLKVWEKSYDNTPQNYIDISIQQWIRINRSFLNKGSLIKNLLKLRYEDVITNPNKSAGNIFSFLDMPEQSFNKKVFKKKLKGVENVRSIIFQHKLNDEDRSYLKQKDIIEISGELGYEVDY